MSKKNEFECVECGFQSPIMYGKCPRCENWNSIVKISSYSNDWENVSGVKSESAERLDDIEPPDSERIRSGVPEFDRVLGGGISSGSVILLGGEPGIGKSTLLLEIAGNLSKNKKKIIYYSGEESPFQIKNRSSRLELDSSGIYLLTMGTFEDLKSEIVRIKPTHIIIDSIQTIDSKSSPGIPGSLQKIR